MVTGDHQQFLGPRAASEPSTRAGTLLPLGQGSLRLDQLCHIPTVTVKGKSKETTLIGLGQWGPSLKLRAGHSKPDLGNRVAGGGARRGYYQIHYRIQSNLHSAYIRVNAPHLSIPALHVEIWVMLSCHVHYSLRKPLFTVSSSEWARILLLRLQSPCQTQLQFLPAFLQMHCAASQFSSLQFSRSVVSDPSRPHESQHARHPCPSPTPGVHSDSRPSSQ